MIVYSFPKKEEVFMKAARVLAFVLIGISAVTGAVVFAQTAPEQAKQPAVQVKPIDNLPPGYAFQALGPNGPGYFVNIQDQSAQLVHDYVKAEKDDEKKEIRKKLAEALGKQFDAHMEQQQKELVDLENQIAKLRSLLKKRQEAKTTIIDNRMDQLIRDAEGLGWTAPGSPNQPGALFRPNAYYRSSNATGTGRFPIERPPADTQKAPPK